MREDIHQTVIEVTKRFPQQPSIMDRVCGFIRNMTVDQGFCFDFLFLQCLLFFGFLSVLFGECRNQADPLS